MKRAVILAAALLSGCAVPNSPLEGIAPPRVDAMAVPGNTAAPSYVTARGLIEAGQLPADWDDYTTRGFIILTEADKSKRQKRVCERFVQLPRLAITNSPLLHASGKKVAATYWPVREAVSDTDCGQLREHYDYEVAKLLLQVLDRTATKGPLIAAEREGKVAIIDLSSADKNWIDAMIPAWANAMSAAGDQDIVVKGGFITKFCDAAGVDVQNVPVAVYDVIDLEQSSLQTAARFAYGLTTTLVPVGAKIDKVVDTTCGKFKAQDVALLTSRESQSRT